MRRIKRAYRDGQVAAGLQAFYQGVILPELAHIVAKVEGVEVVDDGITGYIGGASASAVANHDVP
jgi:hypothetical protein